MIRISSKSWIRILLFFYLFSSFISASHIHHDMQASDNHCSVCLVVKNLHNGDITPTVTVDNIVYTYNTITPWIEHYTLYTNLKYIYSQAPPYFS